ncbi:MAG TPA: hypothetical protein VKQ36_07790 [Ktedonobacterales bacterium]|nr:hypothetical protein [Ktedonobacterales bacterium]
MNQTRQRERQEQREQQAPQWGEVVRDPRESIDWRRHRHGCPYYRERWFPQSDLEAGEPMYQVFCLMNTPPESWAEQDKCLVSRTRCWRLAEGPVSNHQTGEASAPDIPLGSVRRRSPNPTN